LGLMKADQMSEFVDIIMKNLAGSGMELQFKKHFSEVIGKKIN